MMEFITTLSAAIWQILSTYILVRDVLFFIGLWLTLLSLDSLTRKNSGRDIFEAAIMISIIVLLIDILVWGFPYMAGWFISDNPHGMTPLENLAVALKVFLIQVKDAVSWLIKLVAAALFVLSCLSLVQLIFQNPIRKMLEMRPIATASDTPRTEKDIDKTYKNRMLILIIIGISGAIYWGVFCWQSYNNYGKNIQPKETAAYTAAVSYFYNFIPL